MDYAKRNEEYFAARNAKVRAKIQKKIANGHAVIRREFGGVPHVALDYGPGKCSSSFIEA